MFERITVQPQRKPTKRYAFKYGFLAETMLFYGRVNIVTDKISLTCLVRDFGPELLLEYLKRKYLTIFFEENATFIVGQPLRPGCEIVTATLLGVPDGQIWETLLHAVSSVVRRTGKARRLAMRLKSLIQKRPIDEQLPNRFIRGLNAQYVEEGAKSVLTSLFPTEALPDPFRFDVEFLRDGRLRVESNINFDEINTKYDREQRLWLSPSHAPSLLNPMICPNYLIGRLFRAQKLAEDAALTGSEIAVEPLYSRLIALKTADILRSAGREGEQLDAFQQLLFNDSNALAEAIDSGKRTFADLLPILDKADKFRSWLQSCPPTANLLTEYLREVRSNTWLDGLPGKTLRWGIFTALQGAVGGFIAGPVGMAAGLGLGAIDTLLLDKLIRGWKPHHFIDSDVREFLAT